MFSVNRSSLSHLYLTYYTSLIKVVSITICLLFMCSIASKNNVVMLFFLSVALLCFYDRFFVACFPMYTIFHSYVSKTIIIILNGIRKIKHTLMKVQNSLLSTKKISLLDGLLSIAMDVSDGNNLKSSQNSLCHQLVIYCNTTNITKSLKWKESHLWLPEQHEGKVSLIQS